jgi:hypothetical protein
MNIAASLITGLALTLGLGQAAVGAVPKLSGKYTFHSLNQCEAKVAFAQTSNGFVTVVKTAVLNGPNLNTTGANVAAWPVNASLALSQTGLISIGTGYITFLPPAAATGQASVSGSTTFEGGSLRVNASGLAMLPKLQDGNAPYAVTATTFTIDGHAYNMTFGNVISGVARTLNMVRTYTNTANQNPNCVNSLTLTKQ